MENPIYYIGSDNEDNMSAERRYSMNPNFGQSSES